jgi:hypothetical protein
MEHSYSPFNIRPYAMRLLNLVSTPQIFCNEVVEYMPEERDDEQIQQVEFAERERHHATWQHAIGSRDFYLILSLNSIISMQIIIFFFFYQNS